MRIEHVSQPFRAEIAKKLDAVEKKSAPSKAKKSDSAEFSSGGRLLNETKASVETAKLHVANAPEVRMEKVNEVKQKIKEGYYNSPEFAGKLADKLIQDIGKELGIS